MMTNLVLDCSISIVKAPEQLNNGTFQIIMYLTSYSVEDFPAQEK